MPRNGSGSYSLPQAPFTPGTTISSAAVNSDFSDIAQALTTSIASDGQTPITSPLKQDSGTYLHPSWTFSGDTSAGIFLLAAGAVGLAAGGYGLIAGATGAIVTAATPAAAGTNYTVGDTITLPTGATVLRPAVLTVASLSGSGVASVTVTDPGLYVTAPSNPVAQGSSSGSGTGATFNLTTATDDYVADYDGAVFSTLWADMGATSYMAGAMNLLNGLALANYIGAANIAAAVQTALPIPTPQGRLTPTSGTPVITSDASGSTACYWTPFQGLWTPIHNGTGLIPYQLAGELPLILGVAQAANQIYDIFLAYNAGSPVIGTGPTWAAGGGSVTGGSCARGSGAGSTQLTRLKGTLVNTVSMTLTYNTGSGVNNLTVAANQGIYLGSIFVDSVAGSLTCHTSYGQNRKWAVWNNYNQVPVYLKGGDPNGSWGYNGAAWRSSNNNSANNLTVFSGFPQDIYDIKFFQHYTASNAASSGTSGQIGIGLNTNSGPTGTSNIGSNFSNNPGNYSVGSPVYAAYTMPPALGINTLYSLEFTSGTSSQGFGGTEASMVLSALWRA